MDIERDRREIPHVEHVSDQGDDGNKDETGELLKRNDMPMLSEEDKARLQKELEISRPPSDLAK